MDCVMDSASATDSCSRYSKAQIASRGEFSLEMIDPAALALPIRYAREKGSEWIALQHRLGQADAFVIVTPEYNQLHAITIRDAVSFANVWEQFDADGNLRQPDCARTVMATLLARLNWWATALREARKTAPYERVVV